MAACEFSHQGYVKRMQEYLVKGFKAQRRQKEKKTASATKPKNKFPPNVGSRTKAQSHEDLFIGSAFCGFRGFVRTNNRLCFPILKTLLTAIACFLMAAPAINANTPPRPEHPLLLRR